MHWWKNASTSCPTAAQPILHPKAQREHGGLEPKTLFKPRHTETTAYDLTPEEKELYDAVTDYLSKKEEADRNKNTHVTLTLLVMQRRLTSSLTIDRTLNNRYEALTKVLELCVPILLLKQRHRLESVRHRGSGHRGFEEHPSGFEFHYRIRGNSVFHDGNFA